MSAKTTTEAMQATSDESYLIRRKFVWTDIITSCCDWLGLAAGQTRLFETDLAHLN
ncbi:uncharacterized protein PHALS_05764 [Plasmopara halstedii]|uniref:Uncharacterized protein n=1 Tax=Plasmopara halstedii TaxID=4781 RepID=A0A0P1AB02_PLAHL|nr:uncharacterized protein PHALS_05764 [Plasmopara halstedii]CEG37705.1 hypothetical protein PHALS_05764 [Plasmopara halstedii]|eukprot:XP_024574074.1 hypothetical protein PHALS_05764 [Plasmopara halstedii]